MKFHSVTKTELSRVYLPEPTGRKIPVSLRINLDNSLPIPRSALRDLRTCFNICVGTRQRAAPRRQPIPNE